MKRTLLISLSILCPFLISSSGQEVKPMVIKDSVVVIPANPVGDSLQVELNRVKADKSKSYQELILTIRDSLK